MPYINPGIRKRFDTVLLPLSRRIISEGELNYIITRLVDGFLRSRAVEPRYQDYNTVIGVLECAKLELYRRLVAPYEDQKMLENGDVFGYNKETESHD